MTRVWLTSWEWECCGDAFAVGDEVDFGICSRTPHPALAELLGPVLFGSIDAIESHHESEFADRVRGRVVAVNAVAHDVTERRTLRRPGHGAPPDAVMPSDGEDWPVNRRELGNGVFVGSRPSRYIVETMPVSDTAVLEPVHGVGVKPERAAPAHTPPIDPPPQENRGHALAGWLVDVEE